jgi:uncharacterized protein YehS (DUF1456 family)
MSGPMQKIKDTRINNSIRLRQLIKEAGLTQKEALERFNHGQARPLSMSGWMAYFVNPESSRFRKPNDAILAYAEKIFVKKARNA